MKVLVVDDEPLARERLRALVSTIEDCVVVYANATILGGRTVIGNDSVIGSSVWLTRSVRPRTTVLLEKPKLRMRAEQTEPLDDFNYQI